MEKSADATSSAVAQTLGGQSGPEASVSSDDAAFSLVRLHAA